MSLHYLRPRLKSKIFVRLLSIYTCVGILDLFTEQPPSGAFLLVVAIMFCFAHDPMLRVRDDKLRGYLYAMGTFLVFLISVVMTY